MTHGCMLWGAALYNNGAVPFKRPRFGESYSMHGTPQRLQTVPPPTPDEISEQGRRAVPRSAAALRDHPAGQRPAHLRARRPLPPGDRHSRAPRRTGPAAHAAQQPRPGHARTAPTRCSSACRRRGCSIRRSTSSAPTIIPATTAPAAARPATSSTPTIARRSTPGRYAKYGNRGHEPFGRPDDSQGRVGPSDRAQVHRRAIPTSQCIVCHIHPGTNVLNSYLGYMWWDDETDGELMYPQQQKDPTAEEFVASLMINPDETAARGQLVRSRVPGERRRPQSAS